MKKDEKINPVFLVFFVLIGIILLDFLVNWIFAERIPRDRTIRYHLEQQILPLVVEKMKRTGKLPDDLDDMEFESDYQKNCYKDEHRLGLVKWWIEDGKLVVEFRNDVCTERAETVLPTELIPSPDKKTAPAK
jgi:hypothetical protein